MAEYRLNIKELRLKDKKKFYLFDSTDINLAAKIIEHDVDVFIFDCLKMDSRMALNVAFKLRQLASIYNKIFMIKDRVDIAKITDADGVHFDKSSFDLKYAFKILDNDKIFGYSGNEKPEGFDYYLDEANLLRAK